MGSDVGGSSPRRREDSQQAAAAVGVQVNGGPALGGDVVAVRRLQAEHSDERLLPVPSCVVVTGRGNSDWLSRGRRAAYIIDIAVGGIELAHIGKRRTVLRPTGVRILVVVSHRTDLLTCQITPAARRPASSCRLTPNCLTR